MAVLEVDETAPVNIFVAVRELEGSSTARVEVAVVVACYDDFVLVWERVEIVDLGLEFFGCAGVCEVAGVDEDVAIGERWRNESVGVGYADYGYVFAGWAVGAEKGEEELEDADEKFERGEELEV